MAAHRQGQVERHMEVYHTVLDRTVVAHHRMVVHMAVVAVHRVVVRTVVVPVHTDSNNWVAVHREVVVDLGHYTSVIIASFPDINTGMLAICPRVVVGVITMGASNIL